MKKMILIERESGEFLGDWAIEWSADGEFKTTALFGEISEKGMKKILDDNFHKLIDFLNCRDYENDTVTVYVDQSSNPLK